jgi:TRAP-type C4-dicarboxylate transport system substrate-binding protein
MMTLFKQTAALAICGALAMPQMAAAQDWKMASGYPDANYLTQTVRQFIEDVQTATDGKLEITLHNNQSLVKLQDIPAAVRRNQVQLGQVYSANLGNQNAMFTLDAIPFLAPDDVAAMKLWEAQKPYIENWFGDQGIRVLFPQFFPPQGFYTKDQVNAAADLEGLSMRIYSDATQNMASALNANPLQVQFGEVPQAFATGLVNAMFTSPQTGIDVQAWDFTDHYNLVGAMRTKVLVVVNEDAFSALSQDEQQAVLAAAEKARAAGIELGNSVTEEQLKTLESNGMTVTRASDAMKAELEKIGDAMTAQWAETADDEQRAVLDAYLASK